MELSTTASQITKPFVLCEQIKPNQSLMSNITSKTLRLRSFSRILFLLQLSKLSIT